MSQAELEKYVNYIRLHNLPRNSSLCQILHFLWEAVDFDADDALIRAYSSNNAIIGFTKERLAEESVKYCNGRSLYGRIISVHHASEEDLERVIEESKVAGPEEAPPRLGKHKNFPDEEAKEEKDGGCFEFGLYSYSDSDSDEMDLAIPDFFKKGAPPDTIDFRRRQKSGSAGQNDQPTSSSSNSLEDDDGIEVISVNLKRKAEQDGNAMPNKGGVHSRQMDFSYHSPLPRPIPNKIPRLDPNASTAPPQQKFSNQPVSGFVHKSATGSNTIPIGPRPPISAANLPPGNAMKPPIFFPPPTNIPLPIFSQPPPPIHYSFGPATGANANILLSKTANFGQRPPPPIGRSVNPKEFVADGQYAKFEIKVTISTKHCLLRWNLPEKSSVDNQHILITSGDTEVVKVRTGREQQFLLESTEGARYAAKIRGFDINAQLVALATIQFRATFSMPEMNKLHRMAEDFCSGEMYQFSILHRCKPRAYFDEIYNQPDGLRLMKPYKKDENGHPGSPINSVLSGFFFSTLLITDSLPDKSPFGDVQMTMESQKMLDTDKTNWYFADFYCNQAFAGVQGVSSFLHYITVVICAKGSQADKYCKKCLIELKPWSNRFLQVRKQNGKLLYLVTTRRDLLVEVYYTETIPLFDALEFKKITPMGRGSSRPQGLPNNKQCQTCNFF